MSQTDAQLRELILTLVPDDGNTIGNARLLKQLSEEAGEVDKLDYEQVRDGLIAEGVLGKGRGRGGSVYLTDPPILREDPASGDMAPDLTLQMQEVPAELPLNQQPAKPKRTTKPRQKKPDQAEVLSYRFEAWFHRMTAALWTPRWRQEGQRRYPSRLTDQSDAEHGIPTADPDPTIPDPCPL